MGLIAAAFGVLSAGSIPSPSGFHFDIECYKLEPILPATAGPDTRRKPVTTTSAVHSRGAGATGSAVGHAVSEGSATTASVDTVAPAGARESGSPLVEEELLVEDVSIDGMCGVY